MRTEPRARASMHGGHGLCRGLGVYERVAGNTRDVSHGSVRATEAHAALIDETVLHSPGLGLGSRIASRLSPTH